MKISRSARQKQVKRAFEKADIASKWKETAWAKKIARKAKRACLTDFDRFKLRVLRQQVCGVTSEWAWLMYGRFYNTFMIFPSLEISYSSWRAQQTEKRSKSCHCLVFNSEL